MCGEGLWKLAALHSYPLDNSMHYSEIAVVSAAFALLATMYMFAGRTKRLAENESHMAAVLRVAFFLLCTIMLIAVTSPHK